MGRKALTKDEFVARATNLHNNSYNYDKTVYTNLASKITVTCPIHGDFVVQAGNHIKQLKQCHTKHLSASGCPDCGKQKTRDRNVLGRKTAKQFIEEAKATHGDAYSYNLVQYSRDDIKVTITCPVHGNFDQTPRNHIRGSGCPRCKNSKGQTLVAKCLSDMGISFDEEYSFGDCIGDTKPLKFDFYIPSHNMLIEYDGEQHFKPVKFHRRMTDDVALAMFERTKRYDQIKNKYAFTEGIELLRIPYTERKNIRQILESGLHPPTL